MSTSSGITPSNQLINSYKQLSDGALVIHISDDNTELVPHHTIHGDLESTFTQLRAHHEPTFPQPSYTVVKSGNEHIFISFIPDSAPIKQKMLYASTKNTLLQALDQISQVHAWTELDELSVEHLKLLNKPAEGPLTEDERVLQNIDALKDISFKKPLTSMDTSILYGLTDELKGALESISSGEVIVFGIDQQTEQIVLQHRLQSVAKSTLADKLGSVAQGPQYSVFDGGNGVLFVYACPSGSKVKERMLYASFKVKLLEYLKGFMEVVESHEVGDLDELVLDEGDERVEKKAFRKPKGPRRR